MNACAYIITTTKWHYCAGCVGETWKAIAGVVGLLFLSFVSREGSFLLPVTLFGSKSQKSGDFDIYKNGDTVEAVLVEIGVSSCWLMLSLSPISSSVICVAFISNRTLQPLYEQQNTESVSHSALTSWIQCFVHQTSINIMLPRLLYIVNSASVQQVDDIAHSSLSDVQFLATNKTLRLMSECWNILCSPVSGS